MAGAQSDQTSPPKYPSPWGSGAGEWAEAYKKAIEVVKQLTLEEKVNLTTGVPAVFVVGLQDDYLRKQVLGGSKNNASGKLVVCLVWGFAVNVFKTLPWP